MQKTRIPSSNLLWFSSLYSVIHSSQFDLIHFLKILECYKLMIRLTIVTTPAVLIQRIQHYPEKLHKPCY